MLVSNMTASNSALDAQHLSRLRWRCRRGMRELDVLLMRYIDTRYQQAGGERQRAFEVLLDLQDPLILAYLTGTEVPAEPEIKDVIQQLTRLNA